MSNSDAVKAQKPAFSYARAAQGSNVPTSTASSPALNGRANSNGSVNGPQGNGIDNKVAEAATSTTNSAPSTTANTPIVPPSQQPTHSSRSSVSSAAGMQPAWTNKGAGVHMPHLAGSQSGTVQRSATNTPAVMFGNFDKSESDVPLSEQATPVSKKTAPVASGGAAPPAIQVKEPPQFGSMTPNAVDNSRQMLPPGVMDDKQRQGPHSRSNSNASDMRPANMSPHPAANQFPMGYPQNQFQQNNYPPALPNNSFRGQGRGGMHYQQGRGGAQRPQQGRNAPGPITTPQQQHPQAALNSPLNSPAMFGYGQQGYMPHNYPGQYGFPNQGYAPQQQPYNMHNYVNPQSGRPQYAQNQYQNPNLQAHSMSSMSRSGSAMSERPAQSTNPASSVPSGATAVPTFSSPRKSAAIRIVNPTSKEEVIVQKAQPQPTEAKRDVSASPAPKPDRPASSGPPRMTSASPAVAETPEQKKAKQDAAKQAILDRIAARKQEEDAEQEREKASAASAAAEKQRAEDEANAKKAEAEAEEARKTKEAQDALAAEEERKAEAERQEAAETARIAAEKKKAEEAAEAERKEAEAAKKAAEDAAERQKADEREAQEKEKLKVEEEAAAAATAADEGTPSLETIKESADKGQVTDVIEVKDAEVPKSKPDNPAMPPPARKRPSQLQLDEKAAPSGMTMSLKKSLRITDIHAISYPDGIQAPKAQLNQNTQGGFKYDKAFLLQFRAVFTDKPNAEWDARVRDTVGDLDGRPSKGLGPRTGSNRAAQSPFSVPAFNPKPLKDSNARFAQSEKIRAQGFDPAVVLSGAGGPSFERGSNFKPNMARKDSHVPSSPRADSKRGGKSNRAPSNRPEKVQTSAPLIAMEDVKPLAPSANRWTPKRPSEAEPLPGGDAAMTPDIVQKKVRGLLNKLTLDKFDRITDQILEIASQSKDETDGRTLRQVIALTFEKATDEAHFSNMYARFCRKMMERTSDEVKDASVVDKKGEPVIGGALFRKYLLSRCQEDFERGWKTELPPKPDGEPQNEEAAMLSDEYYIAAAAKRRGLGLVKFVGELFLMQMLNEKIMLECITKLLANVKNPEEEEVESLAKLVETTGEALDSIERGAGHMNAFMDRMKQLTSCDSLSSRIKFMVMDVIDLRASGWQNRKADKGPKTIAEIHDDAARAAALKESQRNTSHRGGGGGGGPGRFDQGRGDVRNTGRRQDSHGPIVTQTGDGWSQLKAPPRIETRPGDLAKFGKITTRTGSQKGTFGPGGNLSNPSRTESNQVSRTASHAAPSREDSRTSVNAPAANSFAALAAEPEAETAASATKESSADTSERPKLNLLPKGTTVVDDASTTNDEAHGPDSTKQDTSA